MKATTQKILATVTGVLLVTIIAAAVYLRFFFDANAYKPRIAQAVERSTGRSLALDGELSFSLLPSPQLTLREIRLGNAPNFSDGPFATIHEVRIRAALTPLLLARIEIDEIALERPRLHLTRDRKHKNNWADLLQRLKDGPQGGQTSSGGPTKAPIKSVRINAGEVSFRDEAAERHFIARDIDLACGWVAGPEPASVEAKLQLDRRQSSKLRSTTEIELSGRVVANTQTRRYGVQEARLRFDTKGTSASDMSVNGELRGEGEFDQAQDRIQTTFALTMLDLAVKGMLNAQGILAKEANSRIDAKLGVAEFNPRQLLKRLDATPAATRDSSVFRRAKFDLDVAGNAAHLTLQPNGQLDDSTLSGRITLRDAFERHPIIRFSLLIDQINLDRYRSPQPKAPPSPIARDPLAALPLDKMRALGLDMRGDIRVGTLTLNGDRTRNYTAKLDWNP